MFIVAKISYCLLKSATFTYPTKPVRDKVPFVTRSLVTVFTMSLYLDENCEKTLFDSFS